MFFSLHKGASKDLGLVGLASRFCLMILDRGSRSDALPVEFGGLDHIGNQRLLILNKVGPTLNRKMVFRHEWNPVLKKTGLAKPLGKRGEVVPTLSSEKTPAQE